MSWGPDSLLAFVQGAEIGDAVRAVRRLSGDERAAAAKALLRALVEVIERGDEHDPQ